MRICEREPREKPLGLSQPCSNASTSPAFPPTGRHRPAYREAGSPSSRRGWHSPVTKTTYRWGLHPSEPDRRESLFAYQDFHAEHPTTHAIRRVRLYTVAGPDSAARESVRRGALQEFRILENLDHPGILDATDFQEHELGPAILFRREPDEIRLDHFLRQKGSTLSLETRLDLSRQIADALRYAHSHRVIHRALSPKSILVVQPDSEKPQLRLFNWQAGRFCLQGLQVAQMQLAARPITQANSQRSRL